MGLLAFISVLLLLFSSGNAYAATVPRSGLIGNWSPGIGNPSPIGWITTVVYIVVSFFALRLILNIHANGNSNREWSIWIVIFILFLFLSANKQLDLQTALTEILWQIAKQDGWYAVRRLYQRDYILAICGVGAVFFYRYAMVASWAPKVCLGRFHRNRACLPLRSNTGCIISIALSDRVSLA